MAKKLSNRDQESLKTAFLKWVSEKRQDRLSILITGKTGVGKSRLVNALVGERVAKEGRAKTACTDTVTSYCTKINGVEVIVWDSPGLQDGTCNEELYIQDMKSKLSEGRFDVMIYCISMAEARFYDADKNAIRTLTNVFGSKLWKSSVVALTFANLKTEDPDGEDDLAYYLGEMYHWEKAILDFLACIEVEFEVRQGIPIVPTGNYKKLKLPECENWLSDLWIKCFNVMSISSGLAFFQISESRLKYPDSPTATTSTAAAARSSAVDDGNKNLILEDENQSANNLDAHETIPREIPLNEDQEDGLLKRMWKAFSEFCGAVKNVGHRFLRFFTRRGKTIN